MQFLWLFSTSQHYSQNYNDKLLGIITLYK